MFTQLFQIEGPWPGRLAIAPRPRGGDWLDEELRAWRRSGIDIIVSLLEPEEATGLGLDEEPALSEANGIEYHSLPVPDRGVPGADINALIREIDSKLQHGKNSVIHCRQGIGRAGLFAAALLIETGLAPEAAIRRVSAARGIPVPETAEQKLWIDSFAAALAGNPTSAR